MRVENLNEMIRGWFVGNFNPAVMKSDQFEVGVKKYNKGDHESWHVHKIATEITVIVNGSVMMNDRQLNDGDIIVIEPNQGTDFQALTDVTTVVVKIPATKGDKYDKAGKPC